VPEAVAGATGWKVPEVVAGAGTDGGTLDGVEEKILEVGLAGGVEKMPEVAEASGEGTGAGTEPDADAGVAVGAGAGAGAGAGVGAGAGAGAGAAAGGAGLVSAWSA
jgi:hypothetical protein